MYLYALLSILSTTTILLLLLLRGKVKDVSLFEKIAVSR